MFTNKKAKYNGDNKVLIDAACLKTDSKPTTGIANGSKCIEMDTGKTFMFNEEDSEWEELPSSGGGGGGSSDFSTAEVTFTAVGGFTDLAFGIPSISDNKLTTLTEIVLDDGESMTVEVPLYKGYCICGSPMIAPSNATGGVSIGEMGVLTITGDGGVSIAAPN